MARGRAQQVRRRLRVDGGIDLGAHLVEHRVRHLAREESLPDQRVQLDLIGRQRLPHARGVALRRRRSNRLVRFLRALRFRFVDARLRRYEVGAVALRDDAARLVLRDLRDVQRVGTHIRDQTRLTLSGDVHSFVKLLRDRHRALRRETEAARCLLLQRARRKRRRRAAQLLLLLHFADAVRSASQVGDDGLRLVAAADLRLLRAGQPGEPRAERLLVGVRLLHQPRVDRPVLLRHERLDLALAVDDHLQRRRLHAARAQPAANLAPQHRANLVADQPIEHAPALLRVHHLHVDLARVVERFVNRVRRDLVELDALVALRGEVHRFEQVPRDRLALAVGVCRQVDLLRVLRGRLQLLDDLLLVLRHDVPRCEVVIDVNAELRLREIAHVADGRTHIVGTAEDRRERARLRRRLDDHETLALRAALGLIGLGSRR